MFRVKHKRENGHWKWEKAGKNPKEFPNRQKARQYIRNRLGVSEQDKWTIVHPDSTKEPFKWDGIG